MKDPNSRKSIDSQYFGWQELPDHILVQLFHPIFPQSSISLVCKNWKNAYDADYLWRDRYKMLYEKAIDEKIRDVEPPPSSNFKEAFIKLNKKIKKEKRRKQREEEWKCKKRNLFASLSKYQFVTWLAVATLCFVFLFMFIILLCVRESHLVRNSRWMWHFVFLPIWTFFITLYLLAIYQLTFEMLRESASIFRTEMGIIFGAFMGVSLLLIQVVFIYMNLAILPMKLVAGRKVFHYSWATVLIPSLVVIIQLVPISLISTILLSWNHSRKCGSCRISFPSLSCNLILLLLATFFSLFIYHLEYPTKLPLAVTFTPLYILEIGCIIVLSISLLFICTLNLRGNLINKADMITYGLLILLNCCGIVIQAMWSLESVGLVSRKALLALHAMPLIIIYLFALVVIIDIFRMQ